jgi:hypothetical protein
MPSHEIRKFTVVLPADQVEHIGLVTLAGGSFIASG